MKKHGWTILFAVCLLGFTTYTALDTFVISQPYQSDATEMNFAAFEAENEVAEPKAAKADATEVDASSEAETAEANAASEIETSKDTDAVSRATESAFSENASPRHKKRSGSSRGQKRSSGADSFSGESSGGESSGAESNSTRSRDAENSASRSSARSSDAENSTSGSTMKSNGAESAASEVTTYEDENVSITLTEYTTNNTAVYVADVELSSVRYLKAAFAEDTYGKNVTAKTSDIAAANDAVLAINGDFYGARERGYVIRNGVIYRDVASDAELLCIYADGSMAIADQSEVTAQELVDAGVWQAFSFGPALVTDGEISVSENEETGKAMASNPRTAIGVTADGHYLFVVSDGRTNASEGLSLYELAEFMQQLGATTAYNLDGGGSSTMVFDGEVINNPTTSGNSIKERKVSDIVYVG